VRLRFVIAATFAVACAILFSNCASPGPCQFNSECAVGYYCSATKGTCVRNCQDTTRDCDPGEVCDVNGRCTPVNGDGGASDVVTQETSVNDVVTQDITPPPQDSGADVSQPTKIELDECGSDSECKNGLICRALYKGGPTRCAPTCTQSSQCRSGARCLTLGSDTYCADADVGKTCTQAADCNYGCLTPGGYCTTQCTSGSDCPNGFGCAAVGNNGKLCVRAEEYCGGTNNCTLDCDTNILVSSCTLPCTSVADCPQRASILPQWTCSTYCKRPSDVQGPLGEGMTASYACDVSNDEVNLCNDAQHIDFGQGTIPSPPALSCPSANVVDGVSGDVCVDSCRYAGACAYGSECTAIGDISNTRIGLCMPAHGSGEVGDSCAIDGDCAFGYCTSGKCSRDCSADGVCPSGSTCTAVGGTYPNVEGIAFKRCQ
jgi:hypothetical protein